MGAYAPLFSLIVIVIVIFSLNVIVFTRVFFSSSSSSEGLNSKKTRVSLVDHYTFCSDSGRTNMLSFSHPPFWLSVSLGKEAESQKLLFLLASWLKMFNGLLLFLGM
jgi:flagellar basal body-associated protein FliL